MSTPRSGPASLKQQGLLGEMDAALWGTERDPLLRSTITVVFVLDGRPDRAILLDRLERLTRTIPGLRHRLVSPPLRLSNPRLAVDPDFELSYHVRWLGAPEPRTLDPVLDFARQSAMEGFDHDRPLWQVTVIEGLADGGAAIVFKFHHVLADGVGLMAIGAQFVDLTREPEDRGSLPPVPESAPLTSMNAIRAALAGNADRAVDRARRLGLAVGRLPAAVANPRRSVADVAGNVLALRHIMSLPSEALSPIMVDRRGWWRFATLEVDLDGLRRAGKAHGATINDAFLTAMASALVRYHEAHGSAVQELIGVMPVDLRRPEDPPWGNRSKGGHVRLPLATDDLGELMTRYHVLLSIMREDVRRPWLDALAPLMNALGPLTATYMGAMMKHCDFAANNVRGIPVPVFLGGAEVTKFFGFGPVMGTSLNVTLVSYQSTAYIGVNVDAGAVPDVDVLVDCFRRGFDDVLALG